MRYERMPIEVESPEEMGYDTIRYNLAESSVRDRRWSELGIELGDLVLAYGEHRGKYALRELIAGESPVLRAEHVLTTTGAATALFMVATTLLGPDDHLVVIRPNYATNLETPRAIGCQMSVLDLAFEQHFGLDIEQVKAQIRPNTRLLSITNPHNPTGQVFDQTLVAQLIALAEAQGCYLLMDETYRDLNFQTPLLPYAASLSRRVISVCSLSKAFGIPGVRMGWLISQDAALMHRLLAAKEQMVITNSLLDEEVAYQVLRRKYDLLSPIHADIRQNFGILQEWFARQPYLEWVPPVAGVVAFPRLKAEYSFESEAFYDTLYHHYHTLVGPGHWFEQDRRSFRLGFGYPDPQTLQAGLQQLGACLAAWTKR